MVMKRDRGASKPASDADIERFAAGANRDIGDANLDPEAPHTFNHLNVGFNEHDWALLSALKKKQSRSKLSVIRLAIRAMAEKEGLL
jgi:hypothetical protein